MESKIVDGGEFLRMLRDGKIRKEDEILARHIKTGVYITIKNRGTENFYTELEILKAIEYEFEIISEKEDEIKVGEYVRTHKGYIGKIIGYIKKQYMYEGKFDKDCIFINYKVDKLDVDKLEVADYEIKKHSFKLKELLEKGDYVNGMEIDEFDDVEGNIYLGFPIYDDSLMNTISEFRPLETVDIKSIVTKEQFDREKYIVGG